MKIQCSSKSTNITSLQSEPGRPDEGRGNNVKINY